MRSHPLFALTLSLLPLLSLSQTFPISAVCALAGLSCGGSAGGMACCNEASYECRDIAGRVGTFCLPRDDVCYATGAQCAGEKAGVAVDEGKACCDAELAECSPWKGDPEASPMPGSYCQKKCYEKDERCIGAPGFPYVVYKPCCNPAHVCEEVPGGLWGKFCVEASESDDGPDPSTEVTL